MTPQELAARLNGREYGSEIGKDEEAEAKAAGLVVLFGASDDLVELRGAIHDELGAYDGTTLRLTPLGLLPSWDVVADERSEEEAEDYFRKKASGIAEVAAVWCPANDDCSWAYETTIPHATFDVMEDGELYCRGIVFRLADVVPQVAGQRIAGTGMALFSIDGKDIPPHEVPAGAARLSRGEDGGLRWHDEFGHLILSSHPNGATA